jgi:hypothetical protein
MPILPSVAADWRVRIELTDAEPSGVFDRLFRGGLSPEGERLAEVLRGQHLAVSGQGGSLFVYADTRSRAEQAHALIAAQLAHHEIEATESAVEHWLAEEERWSNEPAGETWEEEALERGYAPWEVRVTCESHDAAMELADRLEAEGYEPARRWRYLVVGAASREEAEALAARLGGDVEAGGAVVWEEALDSGVLRPFTYFG